MKSILSAITLTLMMTSPLVYSQDTGLLGNDFSLGIEGEINAFGRASTQGQADAYLSGSYVSLSAGFKDKVRAVVTARLDRIFEDSSLTLNEQFKLGEFIHEAYIEIRDVGGKPIALVIGKQPIAFGQRIQAMPLFRDNPMDDLQRIDQVYGFTVDLQEGLFGLFDQVEISAFESGAGDLEIGKIDSLSVRLSKMLTDQWMLTASHASVGHTGTNNGRETRTSIGLIGESTDGYLVGWAEAVFFSNNPRHQNSNFAFTVGGMIRISETSDVVIEYNSIKNEVREVGLGLTTALTRNLSAGAEVRWIDHLDTDQQELTFGVSMTYTFGSNRRQTNEEYLFDGEE
ncbi:MAG: hypothetical protein COW01_02460 [Bdellovibrionales bacterium CG12_big_fil_rev_8_21_14_0_65_38_15]|nr:MAG: hypothetical protein COW79_08125 [Bdellovibrionales bacterium CG22_combo_CG10-13_8_21_14_all_38_13]PIQ56955.1 MAG: hypothetical protein COW01_02460 [Bdellovibrionales bacterium CG12_big_fil_rev_8_21_14_0_65_38_15]PIR29084.1 MAG: hypothetical protein COV38_12660 [Bdellovibrionales bacterium CG11_big_fil_rev_8_21_14_0_20_38_13]